MLHTDDSQFFQGKALTDAMSNLKARAYLINGLLYEHSSLMLFAADGVGKSVLALQICLEASAGIPVFGALETARPTKTLWVMAERHPIEIFERAVKMREIVSFNADNIGITTELQSKNLSNPVDFQASLAILKKRAETMGGVDLVVVDPIYALVAGGLAGDEGDSVVTRFSTAIQNALGCCVIFVHHSNRGTRDRESGKRVGEDMYGGRFLSAHFTGIYHITKLDGGCRFTRNKNSHQNLLEAFDLTYDMDTYISTMRDDSLRKRDQIIRAMRAFQAAGKEFTINELSQASGTSTVYVYKLLSNSIDYEKSIDFKSMVVKQPKRRQRMTLYKYVGE